MSFSHVYSVPAYYPNFRCKTGDCRHPCCTGWDIAISMQEYFRMIGLDCSPDLRRRLDTAFHLPDTPSEDRYAIISRRWDGDCPLHLPNGLCGLQCECGEDAIVNEECDYVDGVCSKCEYEKPVTPPEEHEHEYEYAPDREHV